MYPTEFRAAHQKDDPAKGLLMTAESFCILDAAGDEPF